MKSIQKFAFGLVVLFISFHGYGQNIVITDDNVYSPSSVNALLEIYPGSNNKGILIPRLTTVQRTAISMNATNDKGMLVYDTDTKSFWYYDGSWRQIGSSYVGLTDADGDTKIQVEESGDEDIIRFDLAGTEKLILQGSRLEFVNTGYSVFIGEGAGANDDLTSNDNLFIGYQTGASNTTGENNLAIGTSALYSNKINSRSTAIGYRAMYYADDRTSSATITYNTAVG